MIHQFIMLDRNEIPDVVLYTIKGQNEVVVIDDYFVVNNPLFLHGFKTYKVSFKNESEGLDYHGNTIIPNTSIPILLKNLMKVKNCKVTMENVSNVDKNVLNEQLDELIDFCKRALSENKWLIHFGL